MKELPLLQQEVKDLAKLLKRTVVKPEGVPMLDRHLQIYSMQLSTANRDWLLHPYTVPRELHTIETYLKSPQMLRLNAEAVVKEEKKSLEQA